MADATTTPTTTPAAVVMKNLTWLKVGHFFSFIWNWLKHNWLVVILFIAMIYAVIFAKNKMANYETLLKDYQDQIARSHAELDQLKQIQQQEEAQQQAINQQYNDVLTKLQTQYAQQLAALDDDKKKQLQNIIASTHDDPQEMARQVNALFGLPIMTVPAVPPPAPTSH